MCSTGSQYWRNAQVDVVKDDKTKEKKERKRAHCLAISEELKKPIESFDDQGVRQEDCTLMHELYSKQRTHKEIVQRTEKLIIFLMNMSEIKDEEREIIWKTTDMNDHEMKVEILKSLQGSAPHMAFEDRTFYINKLLAIPPEDVIDRQIDLVKEICSTGRDDERNQEIAKQGLEYMWNISFNGKCKLTTEEMEDEEG